MKAPEAKRVHVGSLEIQIKRYGGGRYGFDYTIPHAGRIRVRARSLRGAEEIAIKHLKAAAGQEVKIPKLYHADLVEFVRWRDSRRPPATVPQVADALIASKETKGLSEYRMRDLEEMKKFSEAFPCPIQEVERAEVVKWLDARKVGPRRWNNLLAGIKTLWRFARLDGLISADITPVEKIDKRKVASNIQTYSPAEFQALLKAAPEEWKPIIILGGLCGIRPEELCPEPGTRKKGLTWGSFLWAKQKVDLPASVSKVGRRRWVPICPAAMVLLKPWRNAKGDVAPRGKRLSNYTRNWGVEWKPDGLRHSYASYRLAIIKDVPELSLEMGTSEKMIFGHYLDLKHEDEAEEWFAVPLVPSTESDSKQQNAGIAH